MRILLSGVQGRRIGAYPPSLDLLSKFIQLHLAPRKNQIFSVLVRKNMRFCRCVFQNLIHPPSVNGPYVFAAFFAVYTNLRGRCLHYCADRLTPPDVKKTIVFTLNVESGLYRLRQIASSGTVRLSWINCRKKMRKRMVHLLREDESDFEKRTYKIVCFFVPKPKNS